MKILFISTKGPLPTNDGHALRTYNLIRQLAGQHDIYLVSFIKYQEELNYCHELESICRSVIYLPLSENESNLRLISTLCINTFSPLPFVVQKYLKKSMVKTILKLLHSVTFDIVHLDMLPLAVYRTLFKNIPVVLNEHNIESTLLARHLEYECGIRKVFFGVQKKRLEAFEKLALASSSHVLVCSDNDYSLAKKLSPKAMVSVIPNGVDVDYFKAGGRATEANNSLLFVGGLNWEPNRDGLIWFDREIFPSILHHFPEVKLHVVGRGGSRIHWRHPEHIVHHGYVEDIRAYLEAATIFIVPLRIGGGSRLKILDAMAMNKAIISTSIGAEGLGCKDQHNILIRDSSEAFASGVLELLKDPNQRSYLKRESRQHVLANFQWSQIGRDLNILYESLSRIGHSTCI